MPLVAPRAQATTHPTACSACTQATLREQKGERLVEQLQSMLPSSSSLPTTPQDADSPGSWWGPHEGGWVTSHTQQPAHAAGEAGPGCNGHGVSPSSSASANTRDSTDWGTGLGIASYSDTHGTLSHLDQLAPTAARARASGGRGRGDGLAWGVPHVSAEAADDWHLSVHERARSANVPAEVAAALRPRPSPLACLMPCAFGRPRRPRACLPVLLLLLLLLLLLASWSGWCRVPRGWCPAHSACAWPASILRVPGLPASGTRGHEVKDGV
jgi:hypothetical protein